ncbi:MAG: hypothetical protein AB7E47_05855 [Desulfovibrionaceae bacterium]
MDTATLQREILKELNAQGEAVGHPGAMEADALAHRLGVDVESVKNAIGRLDQRGLVGSEFQYNSCFLKGAGYEFLEKEAQETDRLQEINMTFNAPVSGSAIAAGGSQATVANNGATFFNELQQQIEQADLSEEEKKGLLQAVWKLANNPWVTTTAGVVLGKILGS